jgi:hypothetical protein
MTGPILYTAELDLPDEDIPTFTDWYAGRHAPDLYQAGFTVCTCYRAVCGGMKLIDFYEAPDWQIFESPAYRQIGSRDVYGPPLMAKRQDKAHTVYGYRASTAGADASPLDADWIAFARFAATPQAVGKLAEALAGAAGAALIAAGARRVRLAERGRDHPRNPTYRPGCILLAEWDQAPADDADVGRFVAAHVDTSGLDSFVGYRLYPWPTVPRA